MTAAMISSCTSPVERRIRRNPEAFARLNAADQAAVRAGKIREGFDKSTVVLAWGEPDRVSTGKRNGKSYDRWTYVEFDAVMTQTLGPPYGYTSRYYEDPVYAARPVVNYVPREGATVEFLNDKVVAWSMPQR